MQPIPSPRTNPSPSPFVEAFAVAWSVQVVGSVLDA